MIKIIAIKIIKKMKEIFEDIVFIVKLAILLISFIYVGIGMILWLMFDTWFWFTLFAIALGIQTIFMATYIYQDLKK